MSLGLRDFIDDKVHLLLELAVAVVDGVVEDFAVDLGAVDMYEHIPQGFKVEDAEFRSLIVDVGVLV